MKKLKKLTALFLAVLMLGSAAAFADDEAPEAAAPAADSGITMVVIDTGTTAEAPAASDASSAESTAADSTPSDGADNTAGDAESNIAASVDETAADTSVAAPADAEEAADTESAEDVGGSVDADAPSAEGSAPSEETADDKSSTGDGSTGDSGTNGGKSGSQSGATIYIKDWSLNTLETNSKYKALSFTFYSDADSTVYEAYITGLNVKYTYDESPEYIKAILVDLADSFYAGKPFVMSDSTAFADKYWVEVDPIDAEKTHNKPVSDSYPYSDTLLCWAASASNMLELTGWAKEAGFDNECDVFTYFEKHFTDQVGGQDDGLKWFFDGVNDSQITKDGTAISASSDTKADTAMECWTDTDKGGGLFPDYSEESLEDTYDVNNETGKLYDAAMKLKDGYAASISIEFKDSSGKSEGGHAVTLLGYIRNTIKAGLDSIAALFISDSDSDPYTASEHKDTVDSVTMYRLTDYTYPDTGVTTKQLAGYDDELSAPIYDVTILTPYSSSVPKETGTTDTKNPVTTVDYIPESISVLDANQDKVTSASTGDEITLKAQVKNESYAKADTTEFPNPYIYATYTIYCDGEVVKTLPITCALNAETGYGLNAMSSVQFTYPYPITLDKAGNYEIDFTINGLQYLDENDGKTYRVNEAYSGNNTIKTRYTFTVKDPEKGGDDSGSSSAYIPDAAPAEPIPVINVTFNAGSDGGFSVAIEGIKVSDDGLRLYLDNELIDPENYSIIFNADGTISVEFTPEFIKNLIPSTYDVRIDASAGTIAHISMRVK